MTLSWWNRLRMCIPIQWSWPVEVVDLPVGDEIRGAHLVVDAVGQHCTNHTATRTASSAPISKYQWTEESKKKRRKKIRGAWGACARTRGEDLGGGARVGAADGEAAALELRADLFLHRLRRVARHRRLPGSAGIGFWWGEEKGEREEGGDLGETRGFGGNGGEAKNQNGGKIFAGKSKP